MRTLRGAACAGLLALATACTADGTANAPVVESDSAGVTIVMNDPALVDRECRVDPEPHVAIGSAEGAPEYELYRVFGASQLSDGRIVLVNQGSQELRFYDATGRYQSSSGRAGRGPGEFADAFYLWVLPGDTVWVGDYRPWQFLVFAPDGRWIRNVRPQPELPNSPSVMEVLDDGRMLLATRPFTSPGPTWQVQQLTVIMYGPDGSVRDTVGTFANGRWGMLEEHPNLGLYPLFESFARFDARGRTVLIGHGAEPEFRMHTADDELRLDRIVRWTTGSREITPSDIDRERQRLAEPYADLDPARRRQLVEPLISEKRPVADRMPAYTSLRLGRDGRVWVRDYVRPTEPAQQRWFVFDSDGAFVCRAVLPDIDEALEFGADYLLALHRDDIGVERVVRHTIAPPAAPSTP